VLTENKLRVILILEPGNITENSIPEAWNDFIRWSMKALQKAILSENQLGEKWLDYAVHWLFLRLC
jgi:hypothetical protein